MLDKLIQEVGTHHLLYFVCSLFGVFAISLLLIPKIRSIALKLNLSDAPDDRSSHTAPVPTFGGVIFYVSYIVILFFAQNLDVNHVSVTLLASISVLFFTGLLDDFRNLSPKIKFLFQIIGVAILMFQPDFRIVSLHGFLGVYEIPMAISVAGSMFFLLALINAFNLIDGIDGLSGITGIIIASFYSFMLFNLGYYFYLSISLATIGTLLAFLRFNFSIKRKIFMGDTGSLVIGLVLGLLTLKLMAVGDAAHNSLSFNRSQLPLFLAGVLFIPTLDTIRVMLLRFTRGVSMFKPDRNHIHHILIDFGFSHRKASFCIGFINFIVASIMFYVTQQFTIVISLLILISMFFIAFTVLFIMNKNQTAIRLKVKIRKSMVKLLSL
jgi:UDP-N-acetylmuramyl pentapeptide phosphotransferase/UDP-N-acetylglucosamine-1-phosphate transferase